MKKTIKAVIAVLTAALMLMAFASCEEEKKDNEENSLVKGIFESMIAPRNTAQKANLPLSLTAIISFILLTTRTKRALAATLSL